MHNEFPVHQIGKAYGAEYLPAYLGIAAPERIERPVSGFIFWPSLSEPFPCFMVRLMLCRIRRAQIRTR